MKTVSEVKPPLEQKFEIKLFDNSLKDEWDSFVEHRSVNGTFLHTRRFYDHNTLNKSTDHSFLFYKGKKLMAVIPFNFCTTETGVILDSYARATYGGFVFGKGVGVKEAIVIVDQLLSEAKKLGIKEIVIKNPFKILYKRINEVFDYALWFQGFNIKHRELEIAINIEERATIQSKYSEGARSGVHKANKIVLVEESENYEDFWKILEYNLSNKHKVKPTHSYPEFCELLKHVGNGKIKLFTATHNGKMVGGVVVFILNDQCLHAQYIAHQPEFQSLRPLNALIDYVNLWGNERGYKYFNLGMANEGNGRIINYGLFEFKESFGGNGILRENNAPLPITMRTNLTFDQFQNPYKFQDFAPLATDENLSQYEKIGFPDDYRKGKEVYIFEDIIEKLGFDKSKSAQTFLDIGPGCSDLPFMIQNLCEQSNCKLLLVDLKEMLDYTPDKSFIEKHVGAFPNDVPQLINQYQNSIDYIVAYSNLHSVFYDQCIYKFIDSAVSLLKPGGKFLLGDIPSVSKRKRFFSTETGTRFHMEFMKTDEAPVVTQYQLEPFQIDDSIVMSILQRYRNFGFETYVLPQNPKLPMHNRREDILIVKW